MSFPAWSYLDLAEDLYSGASVTDTQMSYESVQLRAGEAFWKASQIGSQKPDEMGRFTYLSDRVQAALAFTRASANDRARKIVDSILSDPNYENYPVDSNMFRLCYELNLHQEARKILDKVDRESSKDEGIIPLLFLGRKMYRSSESVIEDPLFVSYLVITKWTSKKGDMIYFGHPMTLLDDFLFFAVRSQGNPDTQRNVLLNIESLFSKNALLKSWVEEPILCRPLRPFGFYWCDFHMHELMKATLLMEDPRFTLPVVNIAENVEHQLMPLQYLKTQSQLVVPSISEGFDVFVEFFGYCRDFKFLGDDPSIALPVFSDSLFR